MQCKELYCTPAIITDFTIDFPYFNWGHTESRILEVRAEQRKLLKAEMDEQKQRTWNNNGTQILRRKPENPMSLVLTIIRAVSR